MIIIINLLFFLLLLFKQSISNDDFNRLPTSPVNYRYFAEVDQILGSCSEVKTILPMSRCIVKISHKYKLKYLSIAFSEELVGTGTVIYKSVDNGELYVIILTAFHIVVPQLGLSLLTFMTSTLLTIFVIITPIIIYYSSIVYQHRCRILFGLILYIIISSCLVYHVLLVIYPFLFNSFFQIILLSNNKIHTRSESLQIKCELISSNIVLSYTWWDDIGK